jgi:hypothetical protein
VTLVLPTGSVIGGEAVAIRGDALVIDIRKTFDGTAYPKGQASIPRALVSFLQVIEVNGSMGRHVGTVAGLLGGLMLAGTVVYGGKLGAWAGVATYITIPICTSAAGHQIGRKADERVTRIKIVAD